MANYLLTGCAGFIAARVAEFLLQAHHTVIGVDNLNNAYDVRLKYWRLAKLEGMRGFQFHRVDITDRDQIRLVFEQSESIDAVIHLAARAGIRQSVQNPWIYLDTNATGTLNLLELCLHHGIGKFVLASTSSLYGKCDLLPVCEDTNTDHPLSPYAASKKAAESLCHSYHHLQGLDVTVFRYFTVYGPAGRPDMSLFRFVQWISEGRPVTVFGDGSQSRDFTYVDDIARGTIAGLRPLGYRVINLGSDSPVVLMDAIRLIECLLHRKAQLRFRPSHCADVRATWANITRAHELLDWVPRTPHQAGIAQLVDWYRENQSWASDLETSES